MEQFDSFGVLNLDRLYVFHSSQIQVHLSNDRVCEQHLQDQSSMLESSHTEKDYRYPNR